MVHSCLHVKQVVLPAHFLQRLKILRFLGSEKVHGKRRLERRRRETAAGGGRDIGKIVLCGIGVYGSICWLVWQLVILSSSPERSNLNWLEY